MSVTHRAQQWTWHSDDIFEVGSTKPKGIAFKSDPLAIILWMKSNGIPNYNIASDVKTKNEMHVTDGLARKALEIRKYYRNKLMMLVLKGAELSQYRKSLYEFVESNNIYYIREDFIPLATKLPEFYEEDLLYDRLKLNYDVKKDTYYKKFKTDAMLELTPIELNRRKSRSSDVVNYYFTDRKNRLFKIWLAPNNPCLHLFDREFSKDKITIKGNIAGEKIKGNEIYCFNINNWTVQE